MGGERGKKSGRGPRPRRPLGSCLRRRWGGLKNGSAGWLFTRGGGRERSGGWRGGVAAEWPRARAARGGGGIGVRDGHRDGPAPGERGGGCASTHPARTHLPRRVGKGSGGEAGKGGETGGDRGRVGRDTKAREGGGWEGDGDYSTHHRSNSWGKGIAVCRCTGGGRVGGAGAVTPMRRGAHERGCWPETPPTAGAHPHARGCGREGGVGQSRRPTHQPTVGGWPRIQRQRMEQGAGVSATDPWDRCKTARREGGVSG